MKNPVITFQVTTFLLIFLLMPSCKGEGTGQLPGGTGLESENAGSGIVLNDKQSEEGPEAQPGIQVASNTQGGSSGNPGNPGSGNPSDNENKFFKIRKGVPTVGGQHCPAGSQVAEGSNDTAGMVSIGSNNQSFTCVINFSEPYPKVPICFITGQGWVTPPDMTFKINAASVDLIEISGTTPTTPLAGYVFNYLCIPSQ